MEENDTTGTDFLLAGFPMTWEQEVIAFFVFLFIYVLTVLSNILIIALVRVDRCLHKPMYFFLSNFSFLEIWYISCTIPKMLSDFLSKKKSVSKNGCIVQFYFLFFCGAMENLLLSVMAFDRFIAICYPLRYPAVMNDTTCSRLAGGCWITSFLIMLLPAVPMSQLPFCGPFIIDHVFCDFAPLLKLSCIRNSLSEISFLFLAWVVLLGSFVLIMISYVFIISTIVKTSSGSGKQNAFTTCSSHLLVVFLYYGTVLFIYVRPSAQATFDVDKVVSVFYCMVTPLLNPLIYSLRNQDVRSALKRMIIKLRGLKRKESMSSL
ncbi:olfactory receptor 11H4-like [Microcaecilia unicolor]|uniref:Olfactory receptor n=1 Tax=Microcaecilia unicolor TaxID=1415580 RepID=A0A6P7WW61_9AMPH|nr:olfactory receptor 11H4-like [Microcaecilia unicolor]